MVELRRNAVVLDGYTLNPGDLSWKNLEDVAITKVFERTPKEETSRRIQGATAVFTNKTKITRQCMEENPQLQYIGVLATGYDVVDIKAAKERGIVVTNIPSYGTESVAQHAIALLLELTNRVGHHDCAVKRGKWSKNPDWTFWDFPLTELAGKTMGIVGFGRIGQQTGNIARALQMKVIVNDPYKNPSMIEQGYEYVELEELYASSDVIVLHCNLTPENHGLINQASIEKMEKKPFIINNSRGGLIEEKALVKALKNGQLRGAGLDVLEIEPPVENNPLFSMNQCIITPHLSWAPMESRKRLLDQAILNYQAFLKDDIINAVYEIK